MILEFIDRLAEEAKNRGLEFLIIGGHAVIHHGYARMTLDIDFLSLETDRDSWKEILQKFRYRPYFQTQAFSQFASEGPEWPRVDIMFVNAKTWQNLRSEAELKTEGRVPILVPSPKHLVAMKLHAVKSVDRSQRGKDWTDIEQLVHLHRLDPNEPGFADIIRTYGGEDSLAKLREWWKNHS